VTHGLPPVEHGRRSRALGRLRGLIEENALLSVVLMACVAMQAWWARGLVASDGWYTLLSGRTILHSGLPHHDNLMLLTAGQRWVDQQWLAHVVLYGIWSAGGWPLAALTIAALYLTALAIAAVTARRFGASDRSVAVVLVVCFVAGVTNTVFRAQVPAYPLFALVLVLLLADARRASRRVYLVLPVLVLWANVHGSVVIGAALVALRGLTIVAEELLARRPRGAWIGRAAVLAAAPWACLLASPYGLALPRYYESVLNNPTLSNSVTEWAAASFKNDPTYFVLLLPTLWLGGRSRGALTLFARLALALCALLGLLAVRNGVWFALAGAAILPATVDAAWPPAASVRRHSLNLALVSVGAIGALVGVITILVHERPWFERFYPQRAEQVVAAAARADPKLRVFADDRYSDWLVLEDPALKGRVAYDIRFEILTKSQLESIVRFAEVQGEDWQRVTRGYGLLLLEPHAEADAIKFFRREPGTKVLYRDSNAIVLRRASG
jgi:hypothetical protein